MLQLDNHVARQDLGVLHRLRHGVHRREGHMALEQVGPLGVRFLLKRLLQDIQQNFAVLEAVLRQLEARVLGQRRQAHALDEDGEETLLEAKHAHPAVSGLEILRGHHRGVRAAGEFLRRVAAVERPGGHVRKLNQGAVHKRHVDVPALSGAVRLPQRGQQAHERYEPAREIDEAHARLGRGSVGFSRQVHDAGVGLHEVVIGRLGRPGARHPVTREKTAHDFLVVGTQVLIR